MANYANLLATIAANIYTNHNNEVTAAGVKDVTDAMVASLGAGYQYMGVATPTTDPSTPDQNVAYLAILPGTYTDFAGITIRDGEVAFLVWNGSWAKHFICGDSALYENRALNAEHQVGYGITSGGAYIGGGGSTRRGAKLYLPAGTYRVKISRQSSSYLRMVKYTDSTFSTADSTIVGYAATTYEGNLTLSAGYYAISWMTGYGVDVPEIIPLDNLAQTPAAGDYRPLSSAAAVNLGGEFRIGVAKDERINKYIQELYFAPGDVENITNIVINCAKLIEGRYYNSLYINNGSTISIFDENYATEAEALAAFVGVKGSVPSTRGAVLLNANFDPVQYSIANPEFTNDLSLAYCPGIRQELFGSSPLTGKTIVWEGDSICADNEWNNTGWRTRVQNAEGMSGTDYSRGGSTFTTDIDGLNAVYNIAARIDSEVSTISGKDYFIFDGGTNDADRVGRIVKYVAGSGNKDFERTSSDLWPAKFGSWNDMDFSGSYDKTTFCGALEYTIWKVLTSCKGTRLGYIVAPKMGMFDSLTTPNRLEYFREAKAICAKWGVPVLDLWEGSWMNPAISTQYDSNLDKNGNVSAGNYYLDGQHPAPVGYDYLSPIIAAWLKTL